MLRRLLMFTPGLLAVALAALFAGAAFAALADVFAPPLPAVFFEDFFDDRDFSSATYTIPTFRT